MERTAPHSRSIFVTKYRIWSTSSATPELNSLRPTSTCERLEAYLGKPIARLNSGRDFDHWLSVYRGTLPSPQMRWCTRMMKIKPLEDWVGDDPAISYVAIRADEPRREGYVSTKTNLSAKYPFKEDGIDKEGVTRILDEAGVGLPHTTNGGLGRDATSASSSAKPSGSAWRSGTRPLREGGCIRRQVSWEATAMEGRKYTWAASETLQS